jgi:succinate dehydrogenase/fumarate reductase flavoprotein subunit
MVTQVRETAAAIPKKWDIEADVVVIGSGAMGMPAAIRAAEAGISIIVVDTNYNVDGHVALRR